MVSSCGRGRAHVLGWFAPIRGVFTVASRPTFVRARMIIVLGVRLAPGVRTGILLECSIHLTLAPFQHSFNTRTLGVGG